MVANIVKAESKKGNPGILIGLRLSIPFHPLRKAKFEGSISL